MHEVKLNRRDFKVGDVLRGRHNYNCEFCDRVVGMRLRTTKRVACSLCALSRGVLPWWREHIGAIAVAQMAVAGLYGIVLGAKSRQPSIVAYAAIVMLWFFVYMPIRHWKQVEEDERALKRNAENRRSGCRF